MPRPADPGLSDRIVRATADLLEKHGIDGVTMRAVAAEANCSATTIYQRFESKDDLLHHAVVRGLEWFASTGAAIDSEAPAREQLHAHALGYVEWGLQNQAMYKLIFEQRLPTPAEGQELERRRRGWTAQREMLQQLFDRHPSEMRAVSADVAADSVFVSLHGIVSLAISGRLAGPSAPHAVLVERARAIVDALVAQWVQAWDLEGGVG